MWYLQWQEFVFCGPDRFVTREKSLAVYSRDSIGHATNLALIFKEQILREEPSPEKKEFYVVWKKKI